jgi:phosphotransferase system  glucose/maltose/N-acetylglucosamine-specific IIC component
MVIDGGTWFWMIAIALVVALVGYWLLYWIIRMAVAAGMGDRAEAVAERIVAQERRDASESSS